MQPWCKVSRNLKGTKPNYTNWNWEPKTPKICRQIKETPTTASIFRSQIKNPFLKKSLNLSNQSNNVEHTKRMNAGKESDSELADKKIVVLWGREYIRVGETVVTWEMETEKRVWASINLQEFIVREQREKLWRRKECEGQR